MLGCMCRGQRSAFRSYSPPFTMRIKDSYSLGKSPISHPPVILGSTYFEPPNGLPGYHSLEY